MYNKDSSLKVYTTAMYITAPEKLKYPKVCHIVVNKNNI